MKSMLRTMAFLIALAIPVTLATGSHARVRQNKEDRVPPNMTYVYFNKKGEKTRERQPGEATPKINCVSRKCPKSIVESARKQGKTARCWNCDDE